MSVLLGRAELQFTFSMPVMKADNSGHVGAAEWTPAASDVQLSKDGGPENAMADTPTFVGGNVRFILSASEMTGAKTIVGRIDDGGTVQDGFIIQTFGDQNETANLQLSDVVALDNVDNNMVFFTVSDISGWPYDVKISAATDGGGNSFETDVAIDDYAGYWVSANNPAGGRPHGELGRISSNTAWGSVDFTVTFSSAAGETLSHAPGVGDKLVIIGRS